MQKPITADCLYVCGDSWTRGSELIDPTSQDPNHFAEVHDAYRSAHHWPKLVADKLGVELVDGSMAGASNDYMLRVTMYDVSRLLMEGRRPFVIVSWTQLHRFELPKGPEGDRWKSFVSPRENNIPRFTKELWREWSSDFTDVVKWVQQMICLDDFLKVNQLDYLSNTVFNSSYHLYERYVREKEDYFAPYLYQIKKNINLSRHSLKFSLEMYLKQYADVDYGPGGHPLCRGHELLAEQILAQINSKFQFQRLQDQ